jgi:uncharacterized protein YjbI with pentapeptide repeats
MERIKLKDSLLIRTNFSKCNLNYANFYNSEIGYSKFIGAKLKHGDFSNCNLIKADFTGSDLFGAKFDSCKLNGASFKECDISKADFRQSNLDGVRFVKTRYNDQTKFPPGFDGGDSDLIKIDLETEAEEVPT